MKSVIAALIGAGIILAQLNVVKCPVDGLMCVFTGKSESVSGVLMKQYRCPQGHISWSRQ